MRGLLLLLLVAGLGAATFMAWPRLEGEPPTFDAPETVSVGLAGSEIEVAWSDAGSGLRRVEALLESGGSTRPLHERSFPGSLLDGAAGPQAKLERASIRIDPKALELPDGNATLVLRASDWSLRGGFGGNESELRIPLRIDTRPPRLSVESGLTYIRRGGSAAVVYSVVDATSDGVRVGDAFFPGANLGGTARVAIFAIPIDAPRPPQVRVVAIDEAGNEASERFDARIQERKFADVAISLSESFLNGPSAELGKRNQLEGATPVATFQRVNEELRAQSEARISAAIGPASPRKWRGGFEQMYNSSVTSKFAELRSYRVGKDHVSRARHYGFDLASTMRAPITASNDGVVIFAEDNGIYGRLVLIDHGLGITTLYGHLSNITVEKGDKVVKGQEIGRSGATGFAGGDHLHFAVLVGATYVDPVEWWDPKWVREHVEVRLSETPAVAAGPGS